MRRPTADFMLLGTVTLWAFNFTVSKYILDQGFRPLAYASVRYACAALIFVAITLVWEGSLRIGRGQLPLIAVCTALLFANQLSFVYALKFTTATTVALLFGTLPIFTAILARGSGVERLSTRFWAAALVSFAGVAGKEETHREARPNRPASRVGDADRDRPGPANVRHVRRRLQGRLERQ